MLIWLPSAAREANARWALAEALRALDRPARVPVATTSGDTEADLLDMTVPRWRRVGEPDTAGWVALARAARALAWPPRLVARLRAASGGRHPDCSAPGSGTALADGTLRVQDPHLIPHGTGGDAVMGRIAAAGAAFVVVLILLIGGGMIAVVQAVFGGSGGGVDCAPTGAIAASAAGYGPQEMSNAATIVAVGKRNNVPEQGWVIAIAIATAITESQLHNLDHGDRDSLGLFQQRPSPGWGTVAQIMDPVYSGEQFYSRLTALPGWQTMPVAQAAQTAQRSGFPSRYAINEQPDRQIVGAVQGATCSATDAAQTPVTGRAKVVIDATQSQLGVTYAWGGGTAAGPSRGVRDGGVADQHGDYAKIGFDCSGLALFAYAKVGISLPHQSKAQFTLGTRVPRSAGLAALKPADLVFYSPGTIHHVGIYLDNNQMINAYESGTVVRIQPVDLTQYAGAVRLLQ